VPSSAIVQSHLERLCKKRNKVTAPLSIGLICGAFQDFLENVSLIDSWERMIPGITLGITFFHSLDDELEKHELSVEELLNLEPHTQYKPIFMSELVKMKMEDFTHKMTSLGFEQRSEDSSTVVRFYHKDASAGPGCLIAEFQEPLETAENMQPKATSLLQGGSGQGLAPSWLRKATPPKPPQTQRAPVLKSIVKHIDKYLRSQAISSEGHLSFHVSVDAMRDADGSDVRKALEEAWKHGSLAPGDLHGDAVELNIDSVQRSSTRTFSDGLLDVTISDISNKSLRHAGKRRTYQVVKMTCPSLTKMIADMRKEMETSEVGGKSESLDIGFVVDLFSSMVQEAEKVCSRLTE